MIDFQQDFEQQIGLKDNLQIQDNQRHKHDMHKYFGKNNKQFTFFHSVIHSQFLKGKLRPKGRICFQSKVISDTQISEYSKQSIYSLRTDLNEIGNKYNIKSLISFRCTNFKYYFSQLALSLITNNHDHDQSSRFDLKTNQKKKPSISYKRWKYYDSRNIRHCMQAFAQIDQNSKPYYELFFQSLVKVPCQQTKYMIGNQYKGRIAFKGGYSKGFKNPIQLSLLKHNNFLVKDYKLLTNMLLNSGYSTIASSLKLNLSIKSPSNNYTIYSQIQPFLLKLDQFKFLYEFNKNTRIGFRYMDKWQGVGGIQFNKKCRIGIIVSQWFIKIGLAIKNFNIALGNLSTQIDLQNQLYPFNIKQTNIGIKVNFDFNQ